MFCSKSRFVIIASVACLWTLSEAVPPKTWDSIFNAEGEGDYTSVKIEGNIRLGKYTHYKEVQPVSFKVNDGMFAFSVSGNMTVPAEKIEKENFYNKCRRG